MMSVCIIESNKLNDLLVGLALLAFYIFTGCEHNPAFFFKQAFEFSNIIPIAKIYESFFKRYIKKLIQCLEL